MFKLQCRKQLSTSLTESQWGKHPTDLWGRAARSAHGLRSANMLDLGLDRNGILAELLPSLLPPPAVPLKVISTCIQLPPHTFEHRRIPFASLKYNTHEWLRCWVCETCVISVRYSLPSISFRVKRWWKCPWTHASGPPCLSSRTNDYALTREARASPEMTLLSVSPSVQVLISLSTAHK